MTVEVARLKNPLGKLRIVDEIRKVLSLHAKCPVKSVVS